MIIFGFLFIPAIVVGIILFNRAVEKAKASGEFADRRWINALQNCMIIACAGFIINMGWLRFGLLFMGLPIFHCLLFWYVGKLAAFKVWIYKEIKIYSIVSYVTFPLGYILLPDGGDGGTTYMFFALIRNEYVTLIAFYIAPFIILTNIIWLILEAIEISKCKIVNMEDDSISTCEQKEKTIKNIVFDFGNTLISFEPSYIVSKTVSDPDDAKLLCEVVFDRIYFDRLDEGTITDEEVFADYKNRLPERLWDTAEAVYRSWIYNIPEIEGMRELIMYLKEKYNVSVFLLSNISQYFVDHASEIPMLELMDKCVFSCVCGKVKPDAAIFEQLCRECEIIPEQTIFVDDLESNIEGARRVGICGYRFDGDANKLRAYLDSIL